MKTMKYTTADGYTFEGFMFRDTHGQCIKVPYEYRGIVNMGDKLTTELGDVIDLVDEDWKKLIRRCMPYFTTNITTDSDIETAYYHMMRTAMSV